MRVALIQTNLFWNDVAANSRHLLLLGRDAIARGADLIVLPEMCTTGFSFASGELAYQAEVGASELLKSIAGIRENIYVAGSSPEASDGNYSQPYNSLKVFSSAGLIGEYRKIHLFSYGGEHKFYRSGNQTLVTELGDWRVGWFICYDLRFPQSFAKLANRVDLFVVVANWPASRRLHWRTLLQARAIENQAYVVGVNRIGEGNGLVYSGDSLVVSPRGEILLDMGEADAVDVCDLDLAEIARYRAEFSCLTDRRDI
jgi:predicted amidohydrolase